MYMYMYVKVLKQSKAYKYNRRTDILCKVNRTLESHDNFFIVRGLVLPRPICDHSYLLLDRSGAINESGSSLLAKMKGLYQGLTEPWLNKPLIVHSLW